MTDAECVALLRWALPRLGLRFEGYRRLRRRVCRRIARRLATLGLADALAYRRHLEAHPEEWAVLDASCRLPISRFYRDRGVFAGLRGAVLPALAEAARQRPEAVLRAWSAGCASGEEAYTLAACVAFEVAPRFPELAFELFATDVDPRLLERARRACYAPSSAKELPAAWREALFERRGGALAVREPYRSAVTLLAQDLQRDAPTGPFDLVLCRNVAFTYFAASVQREVIARIAAHSRPGAALVLGRHESLPDGAHGFRPWPGAPSTFRFEPEPPPARPATGEAAQPRRGTVHGAGRYGSCIESHRGWRTVPWRSTGTTPRASARRTGAWPRTASGIWRGTGRT